MGWQRYNRTSKVFEVSDDSGASWQVLPLDYSSVINGPSSTPLPPNLAYTDVNNNFSVAQTIQSPAGELIVSTNGQARKSHMLELGTSLTLGHNLTQNPNWALDDINQPGTAIYITDGVEFIRATAGPYPRVPASLLRINSGGGVAAQGSYTEQGRGEAIGYWINYNPVIRDENNTVLTTISTKDCHYMLIGRTCFYILCAISVQTQAYSTESLKFDCPPGISPGGGGANPVVYTMVFAGGSTTEAGYAQAVTSTGKIHLGRGNRQNWPTSYNSNHVYGAFGFFRF